MGTCGYTGKRRTKRNRGPAPAVPGRPTLPDPMRRPLALLGLLLAAPLALAQTPLGTWDYTFTTADGDAVDEGLIVLAAAGGRLLMPGNGIDSELAGLAWTRDGDAFTVAGTLASMGAPFRLEAALSGADAFAGTFELGTQSRFTVRAERVEDEAFDTMDEEAAEAAARPQRDLFEPFALPTPNAYRSASGRPGPAYWQQRADYTLRATLDPAAHTVTGVATLRYTNNSPEALDFLWFHLEQNLFRPESRGGPVTGRAATSLAPEHGVRLGAVTVDGRAVTPLVTDTRMRLDLPRPVAAGGGTVEVVVPYAFVIPDRAGTPRMGRLPTAHGTVYSVAQWFPRVAVFDDVNGWNHQPYLGSGEFYLNYGDVDLEITAPAGYTVVATGELLNPDDVFTAPQRERWRIAGASDVTVPILDAADRDAAAGRSGTRTWRFRAESVRDAAWAASAAFLLDGSSARVPQDDGSVRAVRILSAFPEEGIGTPDAPGWEEATRYGRASIVNNSRWYPYPYPTAVSVASHVGGMEYPMLHFSSVESRHFDLFGVVDHELGHNWFPMIVGSDERRHAWMDEGFNTFINGPSNVAFYDEGDDPSLPGFGQSGRSQFVGLVQPDAFARLTASFGAGADDEILTYPDHLDGREGGWNGYFKPAMGLRLLRTAVLGPERFDAAFRAYIRRWAFKHPQPADFFRTIEDVAGEDLDWFWAGWFDTLEVYDAEIVAVEQEDDAVTVSVGHVGGLVFPTTVEVAFDDGTTARVGVPVEGFARDETVTVGVDAAGRTVTGATLDPDGLLPDVDRDNDTADSEG